jgi:RimJ/RimL family protein N-acetyltransferase
MHARACRCIRVVVAADFSAGPDPCFPRRMDADLTVPVTLTTERLTLEPLGPQHLDGAWATLQDPESLRLTGTRQQFTQQQVEAWLETLGERDDRVDWAIVRTADGAYLGEAVLNDHDPDDRSIGFRIGLAGSAHFGRGYGTEATAAVVEHAFTALGVHRIELEVFAFNPRAQRVYEKVGFVVEGVRRDALRWDGEWVDVVVMAMLETDPRPMRRAEG